MDDDDDFSFAADEPTAMWDENDLKDLGLEVPEGRAATGPATTGTGRHRAIGIELTEAETDPPPTSVKTGQKRSDTLTWIATIVLSVFLGVGMYFLVRAFR